MSLSFSFQVLMVLAMCVANAVLIFVLLALLVGGGVIFLRSLQNPRVKED